MLEEVINLQNKAVNELLLAIKTKDTVTFKAPTGAGKTIMMANLMNSILDEDKDITFDIAPNTMTKLCRDEVVNLAILGRICNVLDCDFGDIMEYIKKEKVTD